MAKYTPSFIDVSGFSRAFSDAMYRQAQLNLRREQIIDQDIDRYFRSYTGKVRPNDTNRYNEYFNNFKEAGTTYMKLNKSGIAGADLTQAKQNFDIAKKQLDDFSNTSRTIGEMQKNLGRMPKGKILNTEQYWSTMSDLSNMDADDIVSKYGGVEKIPQTFGFVEKDFNFKGFMGDVKTGLSMKPKAPVVWEPVIENGKRVTEPQEFVLKDEKGKDYKATFDVPVLKYNVSVKPNDYLSAVEMASLTSTKSKDYLKYYKNKLIDDASNQQDANAAQMSKSVIDYAMNAYGKNKIEDLSGSELFAAKLAMQSDFGSITKPDWDGLGDLYSLYSKATGLAVNEQRKKLLNKQIAAMDEMKNVRNLNTVLSLIDKSQDTGFFGLEGGTGDYILDVINQAMPGLGLSEQSIINAFKNKVNYMRQFGTISNPQK